MVKNDQTKKSVSYKEKILPLDKLLTRLAQERAAGRRVVFTNGCFDILHPGHIAYLEDAAACGDVLVLGLNSDASVRRLKGAERPINSEHDRAVMLAGLASIDYVTLFEEDTPLELIRAVKPDVLVKGGVTLLSLPGIYLVPEGRSHQLPEPTAVNQGPDLLSDLVVEDRE